MKKRTINFSIDGDFITNIARDWLYAEKRPYEKSMALLTDCLMIDGWTESQKQELAREILLGKKKLTGNTADGSNVIADDNADIMAMYPLYFQRKYKKKKPVANQWTAKSQGYERRASFSGCNFEDHVYGWLSPSGKFYNVQSNHEDWANKYVNKHFEKEFYSSKKTKRIYGCGDFLISKSWVLLHNPTGGHARIEYDKELIKSQKEFLYDFFLKEGREDEAKAIWDDD